MSCAEVVPTFFDPNSAPELMIRLAWARVIELEVVLISPEVAFSV